ncbi:MAG: penicillin-insensitive murein endopeptidase [Rhizobiales bacterium]|nr:penicillin-insensitive murein endopeptidase [Hyphomicrobiales bacterium]
MHRLIPAVLALCVAIIAGPAMAQTAKDKAALAAMSKAAVTKTSAKELFGRHKLPANLAARAIGFYAKGCLAGGKALPVNGPAWQVMRLSRNRNWGHPTLIALVEKIATEAKQLDGWNGLLVGDLAQPRGGPMLSGHASHQVGLDADVWLTPMPDRTLTDKEREDIAATEMVKDRKNINKKVWTAAHARLIKRAASKPQVARIFVNPPIKAELCKWATGDRSWLAKVRPYYNHTYHFHIRINCPKGSVNCRNQPAARPEDGTGCGNELAYWMGDKPWPKPDPNAKPPKPGAPLTLAALPAECRAVVTAR